MVDESRTNQSHENFFTFAAETAKAVRETIAKPIETVMGPLLRDGKIPAFWRQGADEIAQGLLKAFPDSVAQHHEPGTINNPLYSDIAKARESYGAERPTPSELVDRQRSQPHQHESGNDQHHGYHRGGHSL